MRNQLIYDLPMRLFHWLFAGLFILAFLIANIVDDESPAFSYHMFAGLLLGFIVLLRIIWGIVGAKHSRFSSFALHPKDLKSYVSGILSGDKRKWAGHNPASSWAALVMLGLTLGLSITGYLMASGGKETFEDIHELLANGFLVVVLMHIAGVLLHAFRHQDGIAMTMIDGVKSGLSSSEIIPSSRPLIGLLFLGLVVAFAIHLSRNLNSQNRTLNFFGTTLQLGENEEDEKAEHGDINRSDKQDEDGDDD